jgi:methyl-accepting chemotaxis protein
MAILNQVVSVNLRQIAVFTAVSAVMWAADWFTVFQPLMTTHAEQMKGAAVITNFAVIISYVTIFLINRFNARIIDQAEQKERVSIAALEKIRAVFEESKAGLYVGKRLSDSALTATGSVSRIQELSRYLIDESSHLSIEASTVNESGSQITDQALKMKDSVHEQASSITETSAAMTEISANIANISKIASAQHKGMDEIIRSLDSQRTLLAELVNQVGQVKSSSDGIAAFVSTIDSISSQTSLLAMNASIEAAHAGNFGKGFSVIAQEIRKLSEETTKSAAKISDTLKLNGEIVTSTSASVASFASYTEKSAAELRTTIQAIEEILSGISEMNTGTQDIMKALQNIVDESQNNAGLVEDVVSEISQQKTALEHISGFAETLRERAGGLDEALSGIENAISVIQKDAAENTAVGEKISASVSQQ